MNQVFPGTVADRTCGNPLYTQKFEDYIECASIQLAGKLIFYFSCKQESTICVLFGAVVSMMK